MLITDKLFQEKLAEYNELHTAFKVNMDMYFDKLRATSIQTPCGKHMGLTRDMKEQRTLIQQQRKLLNDLYQELVA